MRVIIIGGGIGGLCLANGLRKANIDVSVFERQPSANEKLAGYGIHINEDGRRALRNCLDDASWHRFEAASTAAGTHLYFRDTNLQLLAEKDDAVLSGKPSSDVERRGIGRLELRDILLSGLSPKEDPVIHWNKSFSHYEILSDDRARAHFTDGTYEDGDVVIGADGGHSRVREQYLPEVKRVDLGIVAIAGRYVLNAARERALPMALTNGSLNNIVPHGKGWMFVSAWRSRRPNDSTGKPQSDDHYVVWAYVVPKLETPANISKLSSLELRDLALAGVENWSPSLATLVRHADLDTIAPISLRSMQHLESWQSTNITLLGDAIHAMVCISAVNHSSLSKHPLTILDPNGWSWGKHSATRCRLVDGSPQRCCQRTIFDLRCHLEVRKQDESVRQRCRLRESSEC